MKQLQQCKNTAKKAGFTLIELSIVLVIIGLIVGGVLVGQDLIKAAEIRATVSQIEKYDAAANTFRTKYNGLPADVLSPANFGLASTNTSATGDAADGDGMIEDGNCSNNAGYGGESAIFWTHLSQAALISDATTVVDYACAAVGTIADINLPRAKVGAGARFHITNTSGINYYVIIGMDGTTDVTAVTGAIDAQHVLSPLVAFQMDTKLDDGVPTTGRVISIAEDVAITAAGGGSAVPDTAGVDDCYDTNLATGGAYSTGVATTKDAQECSLRISTSF